MSWLLNLFGGGAFNLAAIGVAVVAAIAAIGTLLFKTKQAGVNQQKAKEAEANAQRNAAIIRAGDARPTGGVQSDPNNLDRDK